MVHHRKISAAWFAAGWLSTSRLVGIEEKSEAESKAGKGQKFMGKQGSSDLKLHSS